MKTRLPAAVRGLLEFVFSGFLVGAVTGIVDAWLAHLLFNEVLSFNAVIEAAVIYSALGALVGAAVFHNSVYEPG